VPIDKAGSKPGEKDADEEPEQRENGDTETHVEDDGENKKSPVDNGSLYGLDQHGEVRRVRTAATNTLLVRLQ